MQHYQEAIALGSKTGLSLVCDEPAERVDALYRGLWRTVFMFERQFSRFLPGSELSAFNRSAGAKQFISPEFRDILLAAQAMARQTEGLYNPFILPALQAAGYKRSRVPGRQQDAVDDHSNKSVASIGHLEIGDDWARIPYGTALDLGGCGKGYLGDRLRETLPNSVSGYWFSFGGDIALGGLDGKGQPWEVSVEQAGHAGTHAATITPAAAGGIATSGTTMHKGKQGGKAWHHIIDPRTRQPAETDVLLATVYDKSALRADVLASCAVILGAEKGLQFLKKQKVKAAILQSGSTKTDRRIAHFGNGIMLGAAYA